MPARALGCASALLALACSGRNDACAPVLPELAAPPQRIVAASVLSAEVMIELVAAEHLAGVHYLAADGRYCAVAAAVAARRLTQVAAEPEAILALRPDLVITDEFTKAETKVLLAAAGVPVAQSLAVRSFQDVEANLRRLGALVRHREPEALPRAFRERLERVRAASAGRPAWRLMSLDGGMYSYGHGTLLDELIRLVGARNLAAEAGVGPFRKLDAETVLAWRPDALVIGCVPGAEATERLRLRQDPALRLLRCVAAGRLLFVPAAEIGSTSHHVAAAAERMASTLDLWKAP
jgi:iron complex transport system substrate-binding protein